MLTGRIDNPWSHGGLTMEGPVAGPVRGRGGEREGEGEREGRE